MDLLFQVPISYFISGDTLPGMDWRRWSGFEGQNIKPGTLIVRQTFKKWVCGLVRDGGTETSGTGSRTSWRKGYEGTSEDEPKFVEWNPTRDLGSYIIQEEESSV